MNTVESFETLWKVSGYLESVWMLLTDFGHTKKFQDTLQYFLHNLANFLDTRIKELEEPEVSEGGFSRLLSGKFLPIKVVYLESFCIF